MHRLSWNDMIMSRASSAWCPVTGLEADVNVPRVVEDLVLEHIKEPVIYHRFPVTQGFTAYSPSGYTRPGETTHYLIDLMDDMENLSAAPERLSLGTSYQGRPLEAFRLGPASRQHFMISCVVHGNETDGLTGSFKAFEILMTHPDFASLRSQYTLLFLPCCNPDGHFLNTRMLADPGPHPSGVDEMINLNRVWPWFWNEYAPSSSESKGAAPLDSLEAAAMYNYLTTANGGAPVPVRFLLDQHSTVGDGARYQSRDKHYRNYDEYSWSEIWADWIIWRSLRATQAKRVHEDGMPDLWVNYFRSRFNPHWHAWMSTRSPADNGGVAPISMVCEHNKVAYVDVRSDGETYPSACNYNMDYVLTCAQFMQGGMVTPRDAVLVEHETGSNQVQNPHWDAWQKKTLPTDPVDYRPGYWTPTRSSLEGKLRPDKHMDHHGQSLEVTPTLLLELPSGQNGGPNNFHDIQPSLDGASRAVLVANVDAGGSAFHDWDQNTSTGDLLQIFVDAVLPNTNEKRLAGAALAKVAVLDLGNTGDNLKLITYELSAAYARNVRVTYTSPRIGAATAYDGVDSTYVIGGNNGSSNVQTVLVADRAAHTITELGTNLLPTADAQAEAVYCSGGSLSGLVLVIGGQTTVAGQLRITTIDPSGPTASEYLLTVSGTTLPSALIRFGLEYDGSGSIWIYGGENPVGNSVYGGVWKLTWSGSSWSISEESLVDGLGSNPDPVDYSGDGEWVSLWSRWRSASVVAAIEGTDQVILMGGVQEDAITGLKISGNYQGLYVHDVLDSTIARPQDTTFAYLRYNLAFAPAGAYTKIATSWSAKAHPDSTAAYVRINNAPGDSVAGVLTTRRVRTYYQHPPRWWMRNHATLDLGAARPDRNEDEWRAYYRAYRHGEVVQIDSPMVQTGTLWPSSWSPYGMTRAVEVATWEDVVDPRYLRVKIVWCPSAGFLCSSSDIPLLAIGDYTNGVELVAVYGDPKERAYNIGDTYGSAEQGLRLTTYEPDGFGGTTSHTCFIPVYWGGMHKDVANDRFDAPLTLEIWAHPKYGHGFTVDNAGALGRAATGESFAVGNWPALSDLSILGGGWWTLPDICEVESDWLEAISVPFEQGALLMGDRDPTYGLVDPRATFRYDETFERADDPNLGSRWDVTQQTGAGWNILSNRAVCTEVGWERWDAQPNIRDCTIRGTVRVNNNSCRVGFFSRMNWSMCSNGDVNGYLGSLYVNGSGVSTLQIERFYMTGSTQNRTSLGSVAATYTTGTDIILRFSVVGSSLTVDTLDGSEVVISTLTVVDTVNAFPDAFGICGETPSSGTSVEINNVWALPGSSVKTRITE